MAGVRPGQTVLDLACGTGDITFMLAEKGGKVTGLDVTLGMLQRARARQQGAEFVCADMMALPFAGAGFDVVTAGYGLRNVPDLVPALGEIYRMLRPGGVFLSLDFNRPENVLVREVYLAYLNLVGAGLGLALHRDPDTYRYIPASIRRYPGARRVADLMCQQGFSDCEYVPVLGGLMAIHRARKPVHPS